MFQKVMKYDNIFYSKALQILPQLGFLVWKQTIWQPWWARVKPRKTWKFAAEHFKAEYLRTYIHTSNTVSLVKINLERWAN
jgi:hypothetical protein